MIGLLCAALLASASPAAAPALGTLDPESAALVAAEAERLGLASRPEVAKRLSRERTRLTVEQYFREHAGATPPSDQEVSAALHATADSARLQVVVLARREEAQAAMDRLAKGASLAEESKASIEPAARTRAGDLGWVTARAVPREVATDVFSGPLGRWLGPYDVGGKFFVVKVLDRKVVDSQVAQGSNAQVRARLTAERQAAAAASLVQELRTKAKVAVDEPFLKGAASRGEVTAADRKHVVATVGAGKITYGDVIDALGSMGGQMHARRTEAMLSATTAQLVDRMIVEQAAAGGKYDKNPAVQKAYASARRDILVEAYWDDVAARTPPPTQAEIEARYSARFRDFEVPASRRCSQIVVATQDEATVTRARITGGASFEAMAREVSLDGETRGRGGDLGSISDERLQHMDSEISRAIRQLPAGAVSEPVKSPQGFHLFVCQPAPARIQTLGEVSDRIAASIRQERISAAVNARLVQLENAAAAKGKKGKPAP